MKKLHPRSGRSGHSVLFSLGILLATSLAALAEIVDFTAPSYGTPASASYTIYVPPAIETPRILGVVFLYPGSGGDWRFRAKDPIWQAAVRSLGFALIGADSSGYNAIGSSANEAQTSLANILAAAATATGHAELVNVPIVSAGTSLGGFSSTKWAYHHPSRTIAIAAQRGANSFFQPISGESSNVHTLIIPGSIDNNGITNPAALRDEYDVWRSSTNPNGRGAWAVDWEAGHDTFVSNQTWALSWSWIAESIALRYPAATLPSTVPGNPIVLNPVSLQAGWLGHQAFATSSTGADRSSYDEIAPYDQYGGDKNIASWLPNETVARVYRAFNSFDGNTARTVIPLQGPLAIVGDAAPLASVPNQTDIPQMAVWDVGSTINITLDPREFDDVNAIATMEYYDGSTLLATQTLPGGSGWSLPHTLNTVGIRSLTAIATDSVGNKTSAFRTVVVSPVRDPGTTYWRFETNPHLITDQYDNITLAESTDPAKRPTPVARPGTGPGSAFPDFASAFGTNTQSLRYAVASGTWSSSTCPKTNR